jgi:hypothetical protein
MEEENRVIMDLIRPRKLNFNAPLLSTKRLSYSDLPVSSSLSNSVDTVQNTRVPFSWEQSPGKPKDLERGDSIGDGDTPRPRLPPCLWRPLKVAAEPDVDIGVIAFDKDDGCCDGDDDDDNRKTDVFSDAFDVLSLSETFDIIQQSEMAIKSHTNDDLRLKLQESNGDPSPTYMINRFLPDANALAASSVLHFSNDFNKNVCDTRNHEACLTGSDRNSCASSSPKGCGLGLLFSWGMKHKFCSIKSPVLPCSTSVEKYHHSSKNKKHCSSVHKNHVLM